MENGLGERVVDCQGCPAGKWCDIGNQALWRLSPMVILTDVSKIYARGEDRICALDHVSLDVAAGTFCAFVGPSGCGKSTLLNLIAGLDTPTSGTIHLDGRSTATFSRDDWTRIRRESVGIVFQAFHLIPGLTVEENVAFPLLLRGEQGARVRERVAEVLALVRMTHRAIHRPSELSGGEQQRVAVARAVCMHRRSCWPTSRREISILSTVPKSSACCGSWWMTFITRSCWSRIARPLQQQLIVCGR